MRAAKIAGKPNTFAYIVPHNLESIISAIYCVEMVFGNLVAIASMKWLIKAHYGTLMCQVEFISFCSLEL